MAIHHAPRTGATSRPGQLVAGLVGVGFVFVAWLVPLVSMWSGLVWGMPPEYGGLGWDRPGTYAGIAGVGLILGGLALAALYACLRAARVRRPAATLVAGGALTLALAIAYLVLLSLAPPASGAVAGLAVVPLLLFGFGAFAVLACVF